MILLKRFVIYQHERFPLRVLVFTTLSSILVSLAVTGNRAGYKEIVICFFSALFFVFHVRVIDESRDAAYDSRYYPDRPIQKGLVSINELFTIDIIGLLFTLVVGLYYGIPATVWVLALFVFTTLAWKDFFVPSFFLNRPLLYHIVNSPQMILLQLFIYAILTGSFMLTKTMLYQLLLVYVNIFILEIIRKINIKGEETEAGDVYSKSMGYKQALILVLSLAILAFSLFVIILMSISQKRLIYLIFGSVILIFSMSSIIGHIRLKSKTTEKLMILSGILTYVGFNTLLFLSVI